MFQHKCKFDDLNIIGQRANPLDPSWSEWTLVVCTKCRKLAEWQHHSEEQMHGGDLNITAEVTSDYLWHIYQLRPEDIQPILSGKKKIKRYDRYKKCVVESYV
jgi:hypothetical protein